MQIFCSKCARLCFQEIVIIQWRYAYSLGSPEVGSHNSWGKWKTWENINWVCPKNMGFENNWQREQSTLKNNSWWDNWFAEETKWREHFPRTSINFRTTRNHNNGVADFTEVNGGAGNTDSQESDERFVPMLQSKASQLFRPLII